VKKLFQSNYLFIYGKLFVFSRHRSFLVAQPMIFSSFDDDVVQLFLVFVALSSVAFGRAFYVRVVVNKFAQKGFRARRHIKRSKFYPHQHPPMGVIIQPITS
jgi:hypothetical protein